MNTSETPDGDAPLPEDERPWYYTMDRSGHRLGGIHPDQFEASMEYLIVDNWYTGPSEMQQVVVRQVTVRDLLGELREKQRFLPLLRSMSLRLGDILFGYPRTTFLVVQPNGRYLPKFHVTQQDALQTIRELVGTSGVISTEEDAAKFRISIKQLTLGTIHDMSLRCASNIENIVGLLGAIDLEQRREMTKEREEQERRRKTGTEQEQIPSNQDIPQLEITDY